MVRDESVPKRDAASKAKTSRKNPAYRRMFRNAFRSFMILHVALWVYCLITTWINYAEWIYSIDCPFPNYTVKIANIYLYTQSNIYLSYLTIPILWSAFMPFMLYLTWMNYRWIDLPVKRRSSECWAWFVSLAKARHFEMSAMTIGLIACEVALVFAGLFSNNMIHFPPLGQGVYGTTNSTGPVNLVELPGVFAVYRIGPRLDEVSATSAFEGNTELYLPAGPWILSGYWRMTKQCRDQIEAAVPSFSKGVRWSSMAAVTLIVGITIAFDAARYIASRAAGTTGELDDEVKDYCAGCCTQEKDESLDEDEDEGCAKELCGVEEGEGPCASCCGNEDSDEEEEEGEEEEEEEDEEEEEEEKEEEEMKRPEDEVQVEVEEEKPVSRRSVRRR